jgi:hypothetical protein
VVVFNFLMFVALASVEHLDQALLPYYASGFFDSATRDIGEESNNAGGGSSSDSDSDEDSHGDSYDNIVQGIGN